MALVAREVMALERNSSTGLSRRTAVLLWVAFALALAHHTDHVLRVDHSGWPFRPDVTPFTFSLLAYPVVFFTIYGPSRLFWFRWAALAALTIATLSAHAFLESPKMQYAMWAYDRSIDIHGAGFHNLFHIRSPTTGLFAVAIAMSLNIVALMSTISMFVDGLRRQDDGRTS